MNPKQIYERIRVNYRDAFQFISFGIHRYAKCSSLRNKKLAVKGAPFFTILRGNFTRLQGHKLGYE